MPYLLAIEQNESQFNKIEPIWNKYGVTLQRANSMQDALLFLKQGEYTIIGINADNINYKQMLPILRELTNCPIHIQVSKYQYEDEVEALMLGADQYKSWLPNLDLAVKRGLAFLNRYSNKKQFVEHYEILHYKGITLLPSQWSVFIADHKVKLTKIEYDLLLLFIRHPQIVFSYERILENVWSTENTSGNEVVWSEIKRLRKKLQQYKNIGVPDISNVRQVGYVFDEVC